jgi:electron transfer flavoprotein alpha subunit
MNDVVWVYAEHRKGEILERSLELICEGRRIATQMNDNLSIILMGSDLMALAESLASYGVDCVLLMEHEKFAQYAPEIFCAALTEVIKIYDPGIFLMSDTVEARDLAPRVAAGLKTNLASNCDKLQVAEDGRLLFSRLTHQSKVHTIIRLGGKRPQLATVSPGIAKIKQTPVSEDFKIIFQNPDEFINFEQEKIKITGFIKADSKIIDISDADLIVSGGRGVGDKEGFQLIEDLADALNAAVAGSRVAVDNLWVGKERQIGQSGKTVSPEVMISCGISGAGAHTFGMRNTKTLIAVNKDKAAPIMKMADLGVVGDLHEILPELIGRIKSMKKEDSNEV